MTGAVRLLQEAATGGALLRLGSHWRLEADASLHLSSGKWSFYSLCSIRRALSSGRPG